MTNITKKSLGFGMLVKFRDDDKEFIIKNVSANNREVFVIHAAANRILCKPISDIVRLNRKEVTVT